MAPVIIKSIKIRQIVRIRHMLRRWRKASASSGKVIPSDVPAGHVAIMVGSEFRRFVVHASYLNHPSFKKLLAQAAEEYGFTNDGPLAIPCDESHFLDILRVVSASESSDSTRFDDLTKCDEAVYLNSLDLLGESQPLLQRDLSDKS